MSLLEVLWVPHELSVRSRAPRTAVVVDAIRATTSITTALAEGAASVIPAPTVEAARELVGRVPGRLLCGERHGVPPVGFDLGNSPGRFVRAEVGGRDLVFTTTNGTAAIEAVRGADRLLLGCFRNAGAAATLVARGLARGEGALILCSGRKGRISMDDAWCAGHLVAGIFASLPGTRLDDGARAALKLAQAMGLPTEEGLSRTEAGQALRGIGLARDLALCAAVGDLDVVPTWRDGAFVKGGEEDG